MRAEESMRPVRRRRKCQREEWATSSGRSCSAVWMIIQIMIQVRQVLLCCLHGHPSFSTGPAQLVQTRQSTPELLQRPVHLRVPALVRHLQRARGSQYMLARRPQLILTLTWSVEVAPETMPRVPPLRTESRNSSFDTLPSWL